MEILSELLSIITFFAVIFGIGTLVQCRSEGYTLKEFFAALSMVPVYILFVLGSGIAIGLLGFLALTIFDWLLHGPSLFDPFH
jgi:hypothetical protein